MPKFSPASHREKFALPTLLIILLFAFPLGATELKIHQINVNLGDSTFIEFPDGTTWLIDQGNSNSDGTNIHSYIYNLGYHMFEFYDG